MAKRFTATEIWKEDWFLDMPIEYKLFWYYILSNCDHAGLFKVNLRSFCGLMEVKLTQSKVLEYFNFGKQRIRVISDSLWLIEDFFVYQYGPTFNWNNRVHESIGELYQRHNIELKSIRGLIDLKDRVKDKDKDIKKGGMGENKKERAISIEENFAVFSDGSKQILGTSQLFRLSQQDLKPKDIIKGQIF